MKAYTDLEQSKKLAKILSVESADHHYVRKTCDFMGNPVDGEWSTPKYGSPNSKYANYLVQNFTTYETIPCWSLAALLDFLRNRASSIDEDADVSLSSYKTVEWWDLLINNSGLEAVTKSDPIDACVEMIVTLKEKNLI